MAANLGGISLPLPASGSPQAVAPQPTSQSTPPKRRGTPKLPPRSLGFHIHSISATPKTVSGRSKHPVRASTGSSSEGSGEGGAEQEPTTSLGDWREFRARLVRAGDVQVVTENHFSKSDQCDQDKSVADQTSAASPQDFEGNSGDLLGTSAPDKASPTTTSGSPWAHPIAAPETGCLVIAHPDAFGVSQQYFHQAVIFMFTHGDEGSAGVILNRPSQYTLGQVAGLDDFLPEFAAVPLYMGGDVGPTSLLCMHGVEDLGKASGAQPICSGIFLGGASGAKENIRRGGSTAWDYRWFARYAGWAPGQLEREVKAGYWFLAASSPDLVLKHCVALEKPLWREVMELMGGEYKELALKTYGDKK